MSDDFPTYCLHVLEGGSAGKVSESVFCMPFPLHVLPHVPLFAPVRGKVILKLWLAGMFFPLCKLFFFLSVMPSGSIFL